MPSYESLIFDTYDDWRHRERRILQAQDLNTAVVDVLRDHMSIVREFRGGCRLVVEDHEHKLSSQARRQVWFGSEYDLFRYSVNLIVPRTGTRPQHNSFPAQVLLAIAVGEHTAVQLDLPSQQVQVTNNCPVLRGEELSIEQMDGLTQDLRAIFKV